MRRYSLLLILSLVLLVSSVLPLAAPVFAAVDLTYFDLEPGASDSELILRWGTETETDTAGFRIRRATVDNAGQAQIIHNEPSRGSAISGADYEYVDSGLSAGQVYYYWLVELTTAGQENVLRQGLATAGGESATATPTTRPATPTRPPATATPTTAPATATPTRPPATATPVPTQPPATATPVSTQPLAAAAANTPAATATPRPTSTTANPATSSAPANPPASGVTPPADNSNPPAPVDAAPSGEAQRQEMEAATAAAAVAESGERGEGQALETPDPALSAPVTEGQDTPAAQPLDANSPTPQEIAQATQPVVEAPQAQLVRPTATPRPDSTSASDDNTNSLLLVIGGGSLCGAALLVLVVLFVLRRR